MKNSRLLALLLLLVFAVLQLRVALAACANGAPTALAVAAAEEVAVAVSTAGADLPPCSNHDVVPRAAGTSDQALPSAGTAVSAFAPVPLYHC